MGHLDDKLGSEKWKDIDKLSSEKVRQELINRGYTEIDFESMETEACETLEEARIQGIVDRFEIDLSHLVSPKKSH